MRASSILSLAAASAGAYAQSVSDVIQTYTVSGNTTTYTTTFTYSNGATSFLTQTNSLGVVTGQPTQPAAVTSLPPGVSTQPAVATIPAGLPVGVTSFAQNASGTLSYFAVSVGPSTTVVLSSESSTSSAAGATGGASGSGASGSAGGASATSGGSSTASSSGSSSSSSAASAANNVHIASAGLLGLGALFAALL